MNTKTTLAALLPFASLAILSVCFMSGCNSNNAKFVGVWELEKRDGLKPSEENLRTTFTKDGRLIEFNFPDQEAAYRVQQDGIITMRAKVDGEFKAFELLYEFPDDDHLVLTRLRQVEGKPAPNASYTEKQELRRVRL